MADDVFSCDPCLCETAAKTLCAWSQALLDGEITPDEYIQFISTGVTLTCSNGTNSQTITIGPASTVNGTVTAPYIPYASGPNTLANSWLQNLSKGVALTTGKLITSDVADKSQIDFGSGGDEFNYYNDGGLYADCALKISTAVNVWQMSTYAAIEANAAQLHIVHESIVLIEALGIGAVNIQTGGGGFVEIGDNLGSATPVKLNLIAYANDAAAGAAGLTTKMLYINSATRAITSKI